MGIDIYMRWKGQEEEEKKKAGYLREAYHGGPYVTRHLVAEAFIVLEDKDCMYEDDGYVPIPAKILRERLNEAIRIAIERQKKVYKVRRATKGSVEVKAFIDFVELAERKEEETGQPVEIYASY